MRGPARNLSLEQDVVKMRRDGESWEAIAKATGRTRQRVYQIWSRFQSEAIDAYRAEYAAFVAARAARNGE